MFLFCEYLLQRSSYLHCAPIVLKTLFIVPTDAHYYKIIEMLKQFKIITLAPTCFGSRRDHHQGAVLCLAKTTEYRFSVLVGAPTCTENPYLQF
jgi:hypothetical protein